MDFSGNESVILNRLQKGIPCVSEPFKAIAKETGITESEVLALIVHLKEKKIIRNISGIFEGKKLGYHLSLVAFEVPENLTDKAGTIISSHPGVSHNYLRNHKFNIWFTLAEESEEDFNRSVSILAAKSGARDYLVLRNERLLKIGVFLNISGVESASAEISGIMNESTDTGSINIPLITPAMREAILHLQNDLPVESRPFQKLAESGKLIQSESELLHYFSQLLKTGIIRRYAAVLKHQKAGFGANAMTAWKADSRTDLKLFMNEKAISHLYFRTLYPGRWEHPLFAMIHAKSDVELKNIIDGLSAKSGINDYLELSSLKEFKKKRVRYFSDEFKEWKRLNYD